MEKGTFNAVRLKNKRWRAKADNRFSEHNRRAWEKRTARERQKERNYKETNKKGDYYNV